MPSPAGETASYEVKYAGFMIKQGKIVKNWKNRWFELGDDRKLRYYKRYPGPGNSIVPGSEAGVINLARCSAIIDGTLLTTFKWPCADTSSCFALVTDQRTYYLVCAHADEARDWQRLCGVYADTLNSQTGGGRGGSGGEATAAAAAGGSAAHMTDDVHSESDSDDEADMDAMSGLASALMANDANFKRSSSVFRSRADTAAQADLKGEDHNGT